MKNIAFLISGNSIYNAGIKPFVDIGYGLFNLGLNPVFYAMNINKEVYDRLTKEFKQLNFINIDRIDDLKIKVKEHNIDVLISDDFLPKLKILYDVKKYTNIKTATYILLFYGLNTINENRENNIKYFLGSYVPWGILTNKYSKLLRTMDYIIGCSYTTSYVLNIFYNSYVNGIVYPPVGVQFEKFKNVSTSKKEGLLIYLGHYPDYYFRDMEFMLNMLSKSIKKIKVLTDNPIILNKLNLNLDIYSHINDEELANLYQSSEAIYIPTRFEGFGYVGPEALLFDTPVILDTYQPWLENFPMHTNAVKVLDPKEDPVNPFLNFMNLEKDMKTAREFIEKKYSKIKSAKNLLDIIQKY